MEILLQKTYGFLNAENFLCAQLQLPELQAMMQIISFSFDPDCYKESGSFTVS
jgi:hypothetical protein